jgi:hypothetical protein
MLRPMLEGRNFDPKAVAILVEAFEGIVDELYLRTPAEREKAATILISLARAQPTLDIAELRDDAVRLMRQETAQGDAALAERRAAAPSRERADSALA